MDDFGVCVDLGEQESNLGCFTALLPPEDGVPCGLLLRSLPLLCAPPQWGSSTALKSPGQRRGRAGGRHWRAPPQSDLSEN